MVWNCLYFKRLFQRPDLEFSISTLKKLEKTLNFVGKSCYEPWTTRTSYLHSFFIVNFRFERITPSWAGTFDDEKSEGEKNVKYRGQHTLQNMN